MQQIAQLQQALQEGVLRDQKAEEDRLNLMATLADLEERLAGMEQAGAQGEAQRKTEEKESSDIQRAKIDADAKVRVAEKAAIAERDKAELKRQIEEVGKQVKDLIAQVAEAKKAGEKQESRHADTAPAQPLPPITIGPIVIEKASGAKVIELKKTDDGKYVGTSKEPSE
jgi:N-methylhydantoinase A/oxoprolinase/acetone carboxylase beta subunit